MSARVLVVTSPINKGYHGLPRALKPGDEVFEFIGATYGCCTPDEVPISLVGAKEYPFHGVPITAVASGGIQDT